MGTHTGGHPTRAQSPDGTFESLREKSYKSVQNLTNLLQQHLYDTLPSCPMGNIFVRFVMICMISVRRTLLFCANFLH